MLIVLHVNGPHHSCFVEFFECCPLLMWTGNIWGTMIKFLSKNIEETHLEALKFHNFPKADVQKGFVAKKITETS